MSRFTGRPTTSLLDPFGFVGTNANLSTSLTATPTKPGQAYSAIPANGAQPSSGTGVFAPDAYTYVGQQFDTADGRTLTFVQNGTVALVSGVLVQGCPQNTAFQGLAMTVPTAYPATAGTTQILVTNGSTVLKENQYQQGFAVVSSGTGIGQTFRIASHRPAAASGTFVVTLEDPIQTTLDATSTIDLIPNKHIGVVVQPTTATAAPVGVTISAIAATTAATYDGTSGALTANGTAQYGFLVVKGPAAIKVDSTVTNVGYPVGPSTTTTGTVGVATLTANPQIGISMQTLTSARAGVIQLSL